MSDLSKIMVSKEPKSIEIEYKGEKFIFKLRNLSWAERNLIMSRSMMYRGTGVTIDLDAYYRLSLDTMIVEAPWPKEKNATMLRELDDEFGSLLQVYVPAPFGETEKKEDSIPKN